LDLFVNFVPAAFPAAFVVIGSSGRQCL